MAEEGAQKRRILVAVDGGEESMYALSWCINNVDSDGVGSGDALLLLYGRPPRLTYPFLDETGSTTLHPHFLNLMSYSV